MTTALKRREATYDDLLAVPQPLVAEIIYGALQTHPRPSPRHQAASSNLGVELAGPFQRGRGGPGGWVFLDEPELHLGPHVVVPHIAGWRAERLASLPELPTASEMGVSYVMSIWAGIFGPKGLPAPVVAKLSDALDKALDDPGVRMKINALGGSIPGKAERNPAAFDAYVKAEIARWEPTLRASAASAK